MLTTHSSTGGGYDRAMDVGLALPQYDYSAPGQSPLPWATVVGWAQRAERLGFDSLWLSDHEMWSIERYGAAPGVHFGLEPMVGLGGLARVTTTARLGPLVLRAQVRPVGGMAKQLAAVDLFTDGRLIAGLGAGNTEQEYAAIGVPFHRPGDRLAELAAAIDGLRAVWGDEPGTPPCLP